MSFYSVKCHAKRVGHSPLSIQCTLAALLFIGILFSGCRRNSDELKVMPPVTHPLTREYIGYGVLNASFTHILSEMGQEGNSQGYLRRGTVVRIIERRQVVNQDKSESWILVEGNYQGSPGKTRGWLPEYSLEIYSSESQANTASAAMSQ
jgi:hypothetical protein